MEPRDGEHGPPVAGGEGGVGSALQMKPGAPPVRLMEKNQSQTGMGAGRDRVPRQDLPENPRRFFPPSPAQQAQGPRAAVGFAPLHCFSLMKTEISGRLYLRSWGGNPVPNTSGPSAGVARNRRSSR